MIEKTGIVANTEKELVAWSKVLAMNEIVYFIEIDKIDSKNIFLIYIDKISDERINELTKQYELQLISIRYV